MTHRDEFWHRKYTEDDEGRLVRLPRGGAVDVDEIATRPSTRTASTCRRRRTGRSSSRSALPILGYGFVFKNWWLLAAGVLIGFFGLNAWAIEPSTEPEPGHDIVPTAGAHS